MLPFQEAPGCGLLAQVVANPDIIGPTGFIESHSGELLALILGALVLGTLLAIVPQLLRSQHQSMEMQHAEHMRALEKGQALPRRDDVSIAAGRTAYLVPMVAICAAGTVTCMLTTYKSESLFAVSLTVWSVAGLVSLAAITGGVALLARLAQLHNGIPDEEPPLEQPPDHPR